MLEKKKLQNSIQPSSPLFKLISPPSAVPVGGKDIPEHVTVQAFPDVTSYRHMWPCRETGSIHLQSGRRPQPARCDALTFA